MAEHRTQALVLRSTDHGESDRVVRLYTEKLGRVAALAKGARRSRRRFPGALELLTVSEVRLTSSPRSSLLFLHGARVVRPYQGLLGDLGRFGMACQLAELLERCTADGDANPRLYRFALGALGVLEQEPPDALLGLLVLAKTLAWLGYEPRLERCAACGKPLPEYQPLGFDPRQGGALCPDCRASAPEGAPEAALLRALARGIRRPLSERHELGLPAAAVRWAQRMLEQFCQYHLGTELRSSRFLREIANFDPLDGLGLHADTARGPRVAEPGEGHGQGTARHLLQQGAGQPGEPPDGCGPARNGSAPA